MRDMRVADIQPIVGRVDDEFMKVTKMRGSGA
jgi:hypothetical protein